MRIFIDKQGNKYGFEEIKVEDIQPEWVECFPKENGEFYDNYNIDGTPDLSYVVPIEVPQVLSPKQFRLGLVRGGMYEQAKALTESNLEYEIYYEYSLEFERDHPMLNAMAKDGFNMSDEDIDNFFVMASKI